jgi:hypothetical protein
MYSFSPVQAVCTLCTYLLDFLPTRFHTYWFSYLPNFIPTCFPTYYISYLLVLYLLYFLPTTPPSSPHRRRPALSLSRLLAAKKSSSSSLWASSRVSFACCLFPLRQFLTTREIVSAFASVSGKP